VEERTRGLGVLAGLEAMQLGKMQKDISIKTIIKYNFNLPTSTVCVKSKTEMFIKLIAVLINTASTREQGTLLQ